MQHGSDIWFMFSYSYMDLYLDTKHIWFCIVSACQGSLHLEPVVHHRSLSPHPISTINSRMSGHRVLLHRLIPSHWHALAKKHTHEECKDAMRLMWWPPSGTVEEDQWCCGQSQVPGLHPASVCLSCHDGHLSCPQSVWEEFTLLGKEGREGERERGRIVKMEQEGEWKREELGEEERKIKDKGEMEEGRV